MPVIDNILQRFGFISEKQFNIKLSEAVKKEIDEKLPDWLSETAEAQKWNMPDISIFANQADMYRLSPILGTAVSLLANDIGTSKLNIMRMVGEETRDIKNHPVELLLRTPNPVDSGIELFQNTVSGYLLNGNAVWWLNKESADAEVIEVWPISFSAITPIPDGRLYISHYEYYPGNGKTPMRLETWEICHFKTYNPNNRFVGLSPLESLAITLQGDLAMRKTNTTTYAEYGGAPQSILSFKEFVQEPAWSDVKAEVKNAAKRNEMMMLRGVGDGVTWLQRAMSSKDADFINGLRQNMTDVFNRLCPGLLSMLSENATEANALAGRATYSEKAQWPIMETIAQKITTDILPSYGRKLIAQFEDPRVVDKRITLQERAADEKIMTVEELRKEYKKLDPFGDERDGLLISQINAATGKPAPEPAQPVQPQVVQQDNQNPVNVDQQNPEEIPPAKADMLRWKRYALRTFGKDSFLKFESANIPEPTARIIRAKLAACKSVGDVADVFEETRPPFDSVFYLAKVIENAVDK